MSADAKCDRWEGEWGGIDERLNSAPLPVEAPISSKWTRTKLNDESLVKVSKGAIPSYVKGPEGVEDVLVLEAATDLNLGTAYEPFSPFVF